MKWSSCLSLLLSTLLIAGSASTAVASKPLCTQLLDPAAAARKTVNELSPRIGGKTVVSALSGGELFIRKNDKGTVMGSNYAMYTRSDTMVIDLIKVEAPFRNSGVSRLLIAEAIVRHPEINLIQATLAWMNAAAFFIALNSAKKEATAPNQAERAALEHTPFFKVIKDLGFFEVTLLNVRGDVIELTVQRPRY